MHHQGQQAGLEYTARVLMQCATPPHVMLPYTQLHGVFGRFTQGRMTVLRRVYSRAL